VAFTLKPVRSRHCYSQQELDFALKSIKSNKDILILGPEKIGKSSFLLQISEKLRSSKSHTPVIFSAENCITLESYVKKNLLSIMEAYKELFPHHQALISASILELDKLVSALKIGESAKQCLKLLLIFENDPKTSMDDVVKHLFTFPSILAKDTKTTAVVMIDDADLLHTFKSDKTSLSLFFDLHKSLRDTVFVLAASRRIPLEGFAEISLNPMSIDDTRTLLKDHDIELDEKALNTVYNLAEGVPFYINYFGRLIKHSGKTDSSSVNEAINDSLSNELHFYFSEKLKSLSPKELPILFCMAEHSVNTPSRISRLLDYSQTNVRRFLSIMEEKGFVTLKERGVFEIHDPVFRRWLEVQSRS
jgi:hypothetical protein